MTAAIKIQTNEESENRLVRLWNSISDFLHHAQLIPLVVIVEGYHYYVVLSSHDSIWAALPLALFLDLLHFRTVKQAIETKKFWWGVGAFLSTAVAYAFQFIFYSSPGVDGHVLELWKQMLFAAVVPLGITFMVWHHHENGLKVIRDWMRDIQTAESERDTAKDDLVSAKDEIQKLSDDLSMIQAELKSVRDENKAATVERDAVQNDYELAAADLQLKIDEFKVMQDELDAARRDLKMTQDEIEMVQGDLKVKTDELNVVGRDAQMAQDELDVARPVVAAWQVLGLRLQLAAQVKAEQISLKEAAEQAGVSPSTMRRDIGKLAE